MNGYPAMVVVLSLVVVAGLLLQRYEDRKAARKHLADLAAQRLHQQWEYSDCEGERHESRRGNQSNGGRAA